MTTNVDQERGNQVGSPHPTSGREKRRQGEGAHHDHVLGAVAPSAPSFDRVWPCYSRFAVAGHRRRYLEAVPGPAPAVTALSSHPNCVPSLRVSTIGGKRVRPTRRTLQAGTDSFLRTQTSNTLVYAAVHCPHFYQDQPSRDNAELKPANNNPCRPPASSGSIPGPYGVMLIALGAQRFRLCQ